MCASDTPGTASFLYILTQYVKRPQTAKQYDRSVVDTLRSYSQSVVYSMIVVHVVVVSTVVEVYVA